MQIFFYLHHIGKFLSVNDHSKSRSGTEAAKHRWHGVQEAYLPAVRRGLALKISHGFHFWVRNHEQSPQTETTDIWSALYVGLGSFLTSWIIHRCILWVIFVGRPLQGRLTIYNNGSHCGYLESQHIKDDCSPLKTYRFQRLFFMYSIFFIINIWLVKGDDMSLVETLYLQYGDSFFSDCLGLELFSSGVCKWNYPSLKKIKKNVVNPNKFFT